MAPISVTVEVDGSITGRVYGCAKALNALILAYVDRITI